MKKPLIIASLLIMLADSGYCQTIASSKVPSEVKSSFLKKYPSVSKVSWELEKGKYEASFTQNAIPMSVLFESNGVITESETKIKTTDLPASALTYIRKNYKNTQIREGAKITKANGEINFEAEVNGKDLIFDSNGNFLREED